LPSFCWSGGGLLGDLILGHKPIIAVDLDRYACAVLRERAKDGWFPDLQVWEGDVRLFDPSEYAGRVDCIHAGFPCTDLSYAGKQEGLGEGTRSGLYREVLRIVRVVNEIRSKLGLPPVIIFMENVTAILSNGLGEVLGDLASIGYDARWCCIKASDIGANHERDRWWLYATYANSAQRKRGCISFGVHQEHSNSSIGAWWKNKPAIHGVDDGTPNRMDRLKGIGNGQVPLQAAVAFKILESML